MTPHEGPLAAADCLVPDWPAPEGVFALCTTRTGGVSLPPYDSLNLGTHVGDVAAAVHTNRMRLQSTVAAVANGTRAVFLNQVHGDGVVHLDSSTPDGIDADACVATAPGVACTIMVADCLPILLTDRAGRWVAAAHAGWRGLAGVDGIGVLESLLNSALLSGTARQDILVWLGPCIGPQAFEVGPEVRAAFCADDPQAASFFIPAAHEKSRADLAGLARLRLQRMGVLGVFGNDSGAAWCTFTQHSRFFSHRRDSRVLGQSGRMAACIWLAD